MGRGGVDVGVGGGLGGHEGVPGCGVCVVVLLITAFQYLQSGKVVILLRLLERRWWGGRV